MTHYARLKIAVLGAGGWGTALTLMWHHFGRDVALWTPFTEERDMLRSGKNRLLRDVAVPSTITVESDLEAVVAGASIIILAVPSKFIRETAARISGLVEEETIVVSAAKGLEQKAGGWPLRMSEVIHEGLGSRHQRVAALSGPTHAEEVARLLPTTIVVAGRSSDVVRDECSTNVFRIYTSDDLIGVELGGTLKNPIAIAAGMSRGLGAGDNAMGALVTRGAAEITRLGVAAGAKASTFAGLSGIGDLVTTCISRHSRNGRVGEEIASGRKLAEVLSDLGMVAEGVETARTVDAWGKMLGIETPITSAVARVLFEDASPRHELDLLMTRTLKDEF